MLRSAFLTATLALGLCAFAQAQLVNYGGYATTAPTAVNAQGSPSVPAIQTPVAHVGPQLGTPTQPGETPTVNLLAQPVAPAQPEVIQIQNPNGAGVEVLPSNAAVPQTINLGAASYSENPFVSGESGTNGQSLGEIAREIKQKDQNLNAKTYTNADIDRMNQATGINNGVTANANSNYPTNNGVITPPAQQPPSSIAAPAQNQSTTGNGATTPAPQSNPPQANAKPSAERPYEMAENNPASAGIPQAGTEQNSQTNTSKSAEQNNGDQKSLPKTASRLPLIGVLGFFSIAMGIFVRYQREKTSK